MSAPLRRRYGSKLSIAMIVRDAQDLIGPTLLSVTDIADEIVVVDTGSVDRTIDVAQSSGARVSQFAWKDDFSAARNYGLQKASGDWVLWLDAGETLSQKAAAKLRAHVNTTAEASQAYLLFVRTPPVSGCVSSERAARLRLIPRHDQLQFDGRLCEQLKPSVDRAKLTVDLMDCTIDRSEREHASQVKTARAQRNVRLAQLALEDDDCQPLVLVALGHAHSQLGHTEQAAGCLRRAISQCSTPSTEMLEAYHGLLTLLDEDPRNRQTQITICMEALKQFPLDTQLLCSMAHYLLGEKCLDLASRSYGLAVNHGQIDPQIWHLCDLEEVAVISYSLTLQLLGNENRAQEVLETSLEHYPDSVRLRKNLVDLYIKKGDSTNAIATFNSLPETMLHREALHSALKGALLANGKNWNAAAPYLNTAYLAGCRDPLCLRWLVATHLSDGNVEAAERILSAWQQQEPRSTEAIAYLNAVKEQRTQVRSALVEDGNPLPHIPGQDTFAEPAQARRFRLDAAGPIKSGTAGTIPLYDNVASVGVRLNPSGPQ